MNQRAFAAVIAAALLWSAGGCSYHGGYDVGVELVGDASPPAGSVIYSLVMTSRNGTPVDVDIRRVELEQAGRLVVYVPRRSVSPFGDDEYSDRLSLVGPDIHALSVSATEHTRRVELRPLAYSPETVAAEPASELADLSVEVRLLIEGSPGRDEQSLLMLLLSHWRGWSSSHPQLNATESYMSQERLAMQVADLLLAANAP